jgi:hypothetical protein
MAEIALKDILINARQESHRMRHYFLGVEHLFIALLEIRNGLTSNILNEQGFTTEYVIDAVRRKAGRGSRHRLWAGVPNTPRTDVVLGIAQEIASSQRRQNIQERDLLIAILDENDSIPAWVLRSLGVDMKALYGKAQTETSDARISHTFVKISLSADFEGELNHDVTLILRRMFHGYTKIRVETRLTGGFTTSELLVVTPIMMDDSEAVSVVVKIGPTDEILDEAQRYDRYVRDRLPPLTARPDGRPIAPDTADVAGIKYTFLGGIEGNPVDMRGIVQDWSGERLGEWLKQHLYGDFGAKWWKAKRAYRFDAWREYDWMLPPILTLQFRREEKAPSGATIIRSAVRRSRLRDLDLGEMVVVENFIVQKVDREAGTIKLALAQGENTARPYQIEVREIDFDKDSYFRGEVVEQLLGSVWKTRDDQLMTTLLHLNPDFEVSGEKITINDIQMPNPVKYYNDLLDILVEGSISTIHGDLHLGNILIGPNDGALLIDFALTRDGHSIFDWANLEISLLSALAVPRVDDSWNGARQLINYLGVVERPELANRIPSTVYDVLKAIIALRQIVEENLATSGAWHEYSLSLAFCALRAMSWKTMPINSRRVMYLISAMAMHHVNLHMKAMESSMKTSPDSTDYYTGGLD